ncbi:MAG: hypothetical protein AAFU86_12655 [Pseudomonadota bacterium]
MRILATLLAVVPGLLHAQTCAPWNVADAYLRAEASGSLYTPAIGTLFFRTVDLPIAGGQDQPDATRIRALFTGNAVADFREPQNHASGQYRRSIGGHVTLEVECSGSACGAPLPGEVIVFLHGAPGQVGYTLTTSPCGDDLFIASQVNVAQLLECVTGGPCAPSVVD